MMAEYKTGTEHIDWEQLFNLYEEVGLVGQFGKKRDQAAIQAAFLASSKVVTAWNGSELIGAGRLLSDGVCYGTVFDVGVFPKYRRQGIATGIFKELLRDKQNLCIYLTSSFEAEDVYKKQGFKRHKNAFAKYPYVSEYLEDN